MSRRIAIVAGALALGALALADTARAGGGPATDAYDDIDEHAALDAHGFADVYVLGDFNRPFSGYDQLRAFDLRSGAPSIAYLRLTLARRPRRLGFRVDLGVGDEQRVFADEDPASQLHPTLATVTSYVRQAFVTVIVPVGSGLQLDAGKFDSPVGLEDNESLANWSYSRSLLFAWAEPSLHVGMRASYQATHALTLGAFLVNGWDANILDGNDLRSFAVAADWKPRESIEVVLIYMGGLERAPDASTDVTTGATAEVARSQESPRAPLPPLHFRNELDAYAIWTPTTRLSLALVSDYGHDRARGGVSWAGFSAYARVEATRWLHATVRGELYADPQGFTTGTPQRVAEVTTTLEARAHPGRAQLIARLEYRHDQSNARVFQTAMPGLHVESQDTLALALLAAF